MEFTNYSKKWPDAKTVLQLRNMESQIFIVGSSQELDNPNEESASNEISMENAIIPSLRWKMKLKSFLFGISKVALTILIGSALAYGLTSFKDEVMQFINDRSLDLYVDMGYHTMNSVEAVVIAYCLLKDSPLLPFSKSFLHRQELRAKGYDIPSEAQINLTAAGLILSSVVSAFIATASPDNGIDGFKTWNIKDVLIKYHSFGLAVKLFGWMPSSNENDELRTAYGNDWTTTTVAFGAAHAWLEFCSHLLPFLLEDLILAKALCMYYEAKAVSRACNDVDEISGSDDASDRFKIISPMKDVSTEFYKSFANLLRVVILQNIFMLTYLAEGVMEKGGFFLVYVALAINSLKVALFFWLSIKTSKFGQCCLLSAKILLRKFKEVVVDGRTICLRIFVDQLKDDPIAVGRDGFLVNENFGITFFSAVFTFFTLLASARNVA